MTSSKPRRAALVARLTSLGEAGQRHPGYRRAIKLLNDTFRKAKLAQRLAVLQAAAWLIDVLEKTHRDHLIGRCNALSSGDFWPRIPYSDSTCLDNVL